MGKTTPRIAERAATRAAPETRQVNRRSAVTNGTKIFIEGRHTGPWARRFRDLIELHEADIAVNGQLTTAQRSLCRRCAAIEVEMERMESDLSRGLTIGLDMYGRLTGVLNRALKSLGVNPAAQVDVLKNHYDGLKRMEFMTFVAADGTAKTVRNELVAPFLAPDLEDDDEDIEDVVQFFDTPSPKREVE